MVGKPVLLFCLFCLAFSCQVSAQNLVEIPVYKERLNRNSVYLEAGGNGIIGSLNYERLLPVSESIAFGLRAGGFYLPDGKENYGYAFPAEISMLLGRQNRKLEIGGGLTSFKYVDRENMLRDGTAAKPAKLIPVLRIGARRQIADSPFFVRSAFTFLFIESVTLGSFPIPWLGISAGYSFGK